ncbi:hypothetical protein PPTG_23975 [Phytophthora nicotianae INRA-310]|uniref:Uncharacterized protein n=1 Tax=Phytophthora nicotianae (strain INRA-310) TaxID=761204 RepID=W2PPE4_PHYN3|nr:hypothetical protein PPTG_23975 [Phytophthora nicotianae INRA-310]ETN01880.1 hypothetical protein PPTG_23975 [Phytophthora nicotianae INRA-310]
MTRADLETGGGTDLVVPLAQLVLVVGGARSHDGPRGVGGSQALNDTACTDSEDGRELGDAAGPGGVAHTVGSRSARRLVSNDGRGHGGGDDHRLGDGSRGLSGAAGIVSDGDAHELGGAHGITGDSHDVWATVTLGRDDTTPSRVAAAARGLGCGAAFALGDGTHEQREDFE